MVEVCRHVCGIVRPKHTVFVELPLVASLAPVSMNAVLGVLRGHISRYKGHKVSSLNADVMPLISIALNLAVYTLNVVVRIRLIWLNVTLVVQPVQN